MSATSKTIRTRVEDIVLDWLTSAAFHAFGAPTTWAELLGFLTGLGHGLVGGAAAHRELAGRDRQRAAAHGRVRARRALRRCLAAGGLRDPRRLRLVAAGGPGDARRSAARPAPSGVCSPWPGVLLTVVLWWYLDRFTGSTVPWPDAATTAVSLLATYGQTRRLVESWWLWIAVDVVYVPLYGYKDLWLTAVLYVAFLGLCVLGLRAWRQALAGAPPRCRRDARPRRRQVLPAARRTPPPHRHRRPRLRPGHRRRRAVQRRVDPARDPPRAGCARCTRPARTCGSPACTATCRSTTTTPTSGRRTTRSSAAPSARDGRRRLLLRGVRRRARPPLRRPARGGRPGPARCAGVRDRGPRGSRGQLGVPGPAGARLAGPPGGRRRRRVDRHHHPGPGARRPSSGCAAGPSPATRWVPEYGPDPHRTEDGRPGVKVEDLVWDRDDFLTVVREQNAAEDAAARAGGPLLICDTDAFATAIWEERYLGSASPRVRPPPANRPCTC